MSVGKKISYLCRICFRSWNMVRLIGKYMEIMETMIKRKINCMCLQETKWTGEKEKELENLGFKL